MCVWKAFGITIICEGESCCVEYFWLLGSFLSSFSSSYHSLQACRVFIEKSVDSLMGVPCMLFAVFPFAFSILSLPLIFFSLITVSVCSSLIILPGTLCASWTWLTISFPMFRKCSAIISSNIFSGPFSLSLFSFWDPYNMNVGAINVVQEDS